MHRNINVAVGGPVNVDYPKVYKTKFLKPGIPFGLQVMEQNTKYVIKHNFDLGGESFTVPENCILEFDGGSLSNGTIKGNNTVIKAPLTRIFGDNIVIKEGFVVNGWHPEWFGAVGYNGISDTRQNWPYIHLDNANMISSISAFNKLISNLYTSGIKTILLSSFYYIDDELDLSLRESGSLNICGVKESGFLVYINDNTKYAINIGFNGESGRNLNSTYSNFNIFIDSRSYLKGIIRLQKIVRSNVEDVFIDGGLSQWEEGGLTLCSTPDDNIFSNSIVRLTVHSSSKGHGIYYDNKGYPAVLQYIRDCRLHALTGCGIVVTAPYNTNGNFSGIIEDCEIEGNTKGAIFIVSGIEKSLIRNIHWEGSMNSAVDTDYPISPFIIGAIKDAANDRFLTQIKDLQFYSNFGATYAGSTPVNTLEYMMFIGGTKITNHGEVLDTLTIPQSYCFNVDIKGAVGYGGTSCKAFTALYKGVNINIDFSSVNVTYSDVNEGECAVLLSDTSVYNMSEVKIRNHKVESYTYISNGVITSGSYNVRNIIDDTSKLTTYKRLLQDSFYDNQGNVKVQSQYINKIINKGLVNTDKGAMYCLYGGGRLIQEITGTITQGSNIISLNINPNSSIKVGDIIVGPWFTDGKAKVIAKNDSSSPVTITIDSNAIKSATNAPITGAIVLPIQIASPAAINLQYSFNKDYFPEGANIYTNGKPLWLNSGKWCEFDGVWNDVPRRGTFASKPATGSWNIDKGFAYFCTDRSTAEGQTDGIMIFYKGSGVWVDALGRVVS